MRLLGKQLRIKIAAVRLRLQFCCLPQALLIVAKVGGYCFYIHDFLLEEKKSIVTYVSHKYIVTRKIISEHNSGQSRDTFKYINLKTFEKSS